MQAGEMGATANLEPFEARDEALLLGLGFEYQVKTIVDDAHSWLAHTKIEGLVRIDGPRYPNAYLRRLIRSASEAWTSA